MVHEQVLHLLDAGAGGPLGPLKVAVGLIQQPLRHAIHQRLALLLQQRQQFLLNQLTHPLAAEGIAFALGHRAAHQLLHKQPLHLAAVQKAFHRIEGAIHQGAFHLGGLALEFELPVEVTPLPAVLVQVGHHRLAEAVHGDFVHALRQPLTPAVAMGPQAGPQLLALHGVAAVVAVAHAIGAFDCAKGHGVLGMEGAWAIPPL